MLSGLPGWSCHIYLFGGLNLLFFSNAWASIAFYALVLAVILHLVMSYEERLEKLEKRVKELESAGAEEK